MKQFICLLLIAALVACKKDGSGGGSQKLLLAKVFRKGLLEMEHIYSSDGKKIRSNFYLVGGGVSTLGTYGLYNYDNDGKLKEVFHYSNTHYATTRKIYSYNAQGKVTRIDEASVFTGDDNLDHMDYFELFTYNNKGQLSQTSRKFANFTNHSTDQYEYDDKGNLVLSEGRSWENGAYVLKQKLELTPGAKQMPEHWKNNLILPTDDDLYLLFLTKKVFTSWWAGELVSEYTYQQPVYNAQGYITKLNFHFKSGNTETDNEMTYEYVQQ